MFRTSMDEDEEFDDFKYEVSFNCVCYLIENKVKLLNENERIYINWTKEYFQKINKTLDSLLDKSYIFTPHFVEVVRALANKKDIPREDIPKYKEEFNLINSKLDNLRKNPGQFYSTKDSEYIFKFMKKIEPIFQTPSVPIFTCCGEDIPADD
jgi:hypothetical protein